MITLKNKQLTVQIAELGAELQSIKDAKGKEYLWQGDPAFWPRRSPILFPIVCSVNDDTYTIDGKQYHLPRHGFARDTMFEVTDQSDTDVTLALEANEETLNIYPFQFVLSVCYTLEENHISVMWHVENIDTKEIHFQIGGHPAFNVPDMKVGDPLKGRLLVDNTDPLIGLKSYIDGSHEMTEIPVPSKEGVIEFDDEFFANDSVKLHNCQTGCVQLLNKNGKAEVTLDYGAPVIAFWSPYKKNAPFVCLEPWFGLGDPRGWKGEFKDKPMMNHLLPGASFVTEHIITIG